MDTTQERRGTLSGVLGASTRFDLEATIERELPSDRYADVVALITKLTHRQGEWAEGGNALDWINRSDVEVLQVAAENKAGATHLRIRADYGAMASFAFFAIVFSVIFLTAAAGGFLFRPSSVVGIAAIGVVGVIASVVVSRLVWQHFSAKRHGDLQLLLQELVGFVATEDRAQE